MNESHANAVELSYWPILLAVGIILMAIGIVSHLAISGIGVIILLFSIGGWAQENRNLAQKEAIDEDEEEGEE